MGRRLDAPQARGYTNLRFERKSQNVGAWLLI